MFPYGIIRKILNVILFLNPSYCIINHKNIYKKILKNEKKWMKDLVLVNYLDIWRLS